MLFTVKQTEFVKSLNYSINNQQIYINYILIFT